MRFYARRQLIGLAVTLALISGACGNGDGPDGPDFSSIEVVAADCEQIAADLKVAEDAIEVLPGEISQLSEQLETAEGRNRTRTEEDLATARDTLVEARIFRTAAKAGQEAGDCLDVEESADAGSTTTTTSTSAPPTTTTIEPDDSDDESDEEEMDEDPTDFGLVVALLEDPGPGRCLPDFLGLSRQDGADGVYDDMVDEAGDADFQLPYSAFELRTLHTTVNVYVDMMWDSERCLQQWAIFADFHSEYYQVDEILLKSWNEDEAHADDQREEWDFDPSMKEEFTIWVAALELRNPHVPLDVKNHRYNQHADYVVEFYQNETLDVGELVFFVPGFTPNDKGMEVRAAAKLVCGNPLLPYEPPPSSATTTTTTTTTTTPTQTIRVCRQNSAGQWEIKDVVAWVDGDREVEVNVNGKAVCDKWNQGVLDVIPGEADGESDGGLPGSNAENCLSDNGDNLALTDEEIAADCANDGICQSCAEAESGQPWTPPDIPGVNLDICVALDGMQTSEADLPDGWVIHQGECVYDPDLDTEDDDTPANDDGANDGNVDF